MNRCIGCGIIVQTSFPDKPGYVPENTIIAHPKEFYCKRCYDIRNHNFQYRVDNQSANYLEKLKKIQYEKALVIVLVDIFNISNHFFASVKMCVGKNKILVIFNKIDLLPKDLKVIKFKKIIDLLATNNQLEVIDTLFGSVKKNSFVSQIISKINKLKYPRFFDKKNKTEPSFYNCYLIGMSNVGKSTLMNKIGQICLHYKTDIITTSSKLHTTLDFIKWPLNDKNFIVDTPGIIEPHHFGTYLTNQSLNVLIAEKYIKTRTFQLDSNQTIFLGGLVRIDFFGDDFLLVVDESHVTLPQVRAMYNGDRMRKQALVDYGFRLPSALDNRPLKFEEFEGKIKQAIFVSATPGDYEMEKVNNKVVEQIIRPTGLLDPKIEVKSTKNQIDDLVSQIHSQIEKNERTLITTLTIRMAEELSVYLKNLDIKVAYLHNEIKSLERMQIIHDLRVGKYDVVVGINLLREGIDVPEVSLIAIMDADKQGFLRSERSLIQTIGRAARNANGRVIMYADEISSAMDVAIKETNRRRSIQEAYNKEHGIVYPTTKINDQEAYIVRNIFEQYGYYDSWFLRNLSHEEYSWKNSRLGLPDGAPGNREIKIEDIAIDARKVRPYDSVWDMYYDEFDDLENES